LKNEIQERKVLVCSVSFKALYVLKFFKAASTKWLWYHVIYDV